MRDIEQFARYESFHLFLLKATAADPEARFQSAAEMAEQLIGVLRQVIAIDGGKPSPAPSALFSGELGHGTDEAAWENLPVPAVDPFDPSAGLLATVAISTSDQLRTALESSPRTPELVFRLARSYIDEGELAEAAAELDSAEAGVGGWRVAWWRGVLQLAAGRPRDAIAFFAAVGGELPGELAPKLALAVSHELVAVTEMSAPSPNGAERANGSTHDLREAAAQYWVVAATDPGYASASFGLSRVACLLGDRAGAASALERIPATSSAHAAAQIALCRLRCADVWGRPPDPEDLALASGLLDQLQAEPAVQLSLVRDLHTQALAMLLDKRVGPDEATILAGAPLDEVGLRLALERTYRSMSKLAPTEEQRFALVDQANACRPRTLT